MIYTSVITKNRITTITASTEIKHSTEKVWEVLMLPGEIEKFHPLIRKSAMTTEKQKGVGARRYCELLPMGVMNEVITDWQEGRSFTTEVIGGKMLPPYRFMRGTIKVEGHGQVSHVTFTFSYQLKYGVLGSIMNTLMIRPQFKKAPSKYVGGLKAFVESRAN